MRHDRAKLSRLSVDLATWSDRATIWQHRIPFDDPHEWRDFLERHVKDGLCQLCELRRDGEPIGLFVYRVEEIASRELVVVAVYSSETVGVDLTAYFDEVATDLARRHGCGSIRCHTLRPGLIRRAHALGYATAEVVLRKVLNG